ncbi:MAG: biosynthetic peptidoglycan transglycosylase [Clostridia bacterium]|nr:biosynthetic peptidoglycan transglycosylase [Clostridia bacterium]
MRRLLKLIRNIILFCLIFCIAIGGIIGYNGYQMYQDAISKMSIEEKIEEIKSDENYVTLDEIPKEYKDAVISVEDHRFYSHFGVDVIALSRAVITNISTMSLAEGGSTITQQLAKNMYFSQEKLFTRKIAELFVALELEQMCSKDEILEMYMNISYFGDGFYGIREASIGYLNKEPKDMTLEECTLLAGIPNAPSVYALSNHTDLTIQRQIQVIDAMVKYDNMDAKKAEKLKEEIRK